MLIESIIFIFVFFLIINFLYNKRGACYLFKNTKRWADVDNEALQEEEESDMDDGEDDERGVPSQDVIDLFDTREDRND